jgi:hypothetical protein
MLLFFFLLGEATSFNCYCHTFFFSKRKIIWRGNQVLLSCVVFLCVRLATRVMAILVDDKPMQIKRRESVLVSWISRGKLYFIYICKYMKFSYRFYSVLLNKHFVFEETLALCALFKGWKINRANILMGSQWWGPIQFCLPHKMTGTAWLPAYPKMTIVMIVYNTTTTHCHPLFFSKPIFVGS